MLRNFRFILIIIYFINHTYSLAQDTINNKGYEDVLFLIDDGLSKNYELIKAKSKEITLTLKLFIYDESKKSPAVPFVLNHFLGFGIGSWSQLDIGGGLLGTIGGIGGLYLISTYDYFSFYRSLGIYLLIGTWIIDLISPFTYSNNNNRKLRYALKISDKTNLMILPNVNVANYGTVVPGLMFSMNF